MLSSFLVMVSITPNIDPLRLQGIKRLWGILSLLSLILITILSLLASLEKKEKKEKAVDEMIELVSARGRQTRKIIEGIIESLESPAFIIEGGRITFANRKASEIGELKGGFLREGMLREKFSIEKVKFDLEGEEAFLFILRDLEKELKRIRAEEETKRLSDLGEISSFLSHEIKNSLSVILTCAKSGKTHEILEEIENIKELVDKFIEEARPLKPMLKSLELEKDFFSKWDRVQVTGKGEVMADPYILELVFENLVSNSIEAGADQIKIVMRQAGDYLILEYKDNGKGIEIGNEEKIFLPFFSEKRRGTGLGLSFVKKAILSMGGSVKALPEEGGAKFVISLRRG